jgi:galactitol-specific phosphotransferase system IIC component
MTQSRAMSLIEAATNVVVGYVLAILTQLAVFPLFGIAAALGAHLAIGLAFVGISLVRGYLMRRLFERISVRFDY